MASGVAVRQGLNHFAITDIVHPTCPKCGAPMWLTRIAQDGSGWQQRTFECQACQNETIDVVQGDHPMTMQNEPQTGIRFSTTAGQLLVLCAAIMVLNLAWRYVL
jgi:hypothetical protein